MSVDSLRARRARPGFFIEPCQPTSAPRAPNGCMRLARRLPADRAPRRSGIRLITRNGHDWSDRYPSVVAAVNALRARRCIIDGEV